MRSGTAAALLLLAGLAWARTGAAQAPAPPGPWQVGRLAFSPCELGAHSAMGLPSLVAWCAAVPVPEDRAHPGGRRLSLRVALLPATAVEVGADMVTFLDGGPGGAATEDFPAVAAAFAPLRRHHHVLLVDQRGTGGSNALSCDAEGAATAQDGDARRHIEGCLQRVQAHADPRFYATTDAVLDLEDVRQALGAPRLDLVGVSYGTRVAQQYAARFGAAVRSIVLDSPVPNTLVLLSEHARNLEEALRRRLERCAALASCAQRYGDVYARLRQIQGRLRAQPRQVELRDAHTFAPVQRRFGGEDLAALVRFYLYNPGTAALLPYAVGEASAGRWGPLLAQSRVLVEDVAERLGGGMAASVLCTEDADLLRPDPGDAATLLGQGPVLSALQTCALWPHGERPANFHEPLLSTLPVLVLAGEFDPVTPPRYGEQIVGQLPNGRLLVARGQGHAVLGVGCLPRLVGDFVERASVQGLDAGCMAAIADEPPFIDANGATP